MNDNEQNFSEVPYRATRNLNTMIENPNINMNSATTANIMESNLEVSNQFVNTNVSNTYVGNSNLSQVNNVVDSSSTNVVNSSQNFLVGNDLNYGNSSVENTTDLNENDPVRNFINKANEVPTQNVSNVAMSSMGNNSTVVDNSTYVASNSSEDVKVESQVEYENVYQSDKKKKSNTIVIPKEFRTAVLVVLILLIVVSCFEFVYDFFRNLYIFG